MPENEPNRITRTELRTLFSQHVLFVFEHRYHKDKDFFLSGKLISISSGYLTILNANTNETNTYNFDELKYIDMGSSRLLKEKAKHLDFLMTGQRAPSENRLLGKEYEEFLKKKKQKEAFKEYYGDDE